MPAVTVYHCPRHREERLDGGPTHYTCPTGHGVPAADLDHEFHPPAAGRLRRVRPAMLAIAVLSALIVAGSACTGSNQHPSAPLSASNPRGTVTYWTYTAIDAPTCRPPKVNPHACEYRWQLEIREAPGQIRLIDVSPDVFWRCRRVGAVYPICAGGGR